MLDAYLCKMLHHVKCAAAATPTQKLCFIQNPLKSLRSISSTSNQQSFTVSYLINTCGLSPESALSASKYINLETPEKPDSVIKLFKNHGLSEIQISKLIRNVPAVLMSDPDKTLLPKFEFFHSKGISTPDVAQILTSFPSILKSSLENRIIPSFSFLRNVLQSDEKTITALKRCAGILAYGLETHMVPNINLLRENGVPESSIVSMLQNQPRLFRTNSDQFKEIVVKVKAMGFNPLSRKFLVAVHAMKAMRKSSWERKVEVYKRWGWSEEEILAAFGKDPWCMTVSEAKIMAVMDFFINKMGWESLDIAKYPRILSLSLEKRIVPRASVFQFLLSKGLVEKDFNQRSLFMCSEKLFLQRFLNCYEEASLLLKLYNK